MKEQMDQMGLKHHSSAPSPFFFYRDFSKQNVQKKSGKNNK